MRVLVAGSRDFPAPKIIRHRLSQLPRGAWIIHGANPGGADLQADLAANMLGLSQERYPAEWDVCHCGKNCVEQRLHVNRKGQAYCPAAGPARNRKMLDSNPDLVLAFPVKVDREGLPTSPGTRDTVLEAYRRGFPVAIHHLAEEPNSYDPIEVEGMGR